MKKILFLSVALFVTALACKKTDEENVLDNDMHHANSQEVTPASHTARLSGSDYSQPISISEANKLIQSYLTSINYPSNDTTLISLSFDADSLRSYLNDSRITTVKFSLAHQPSYVQDNYGVNAGLSAKALTLVLVGLDDNHKFIYNSSNGVYEHFSPCPLMCYSAATISD